MARAGRIEATVRTLDGDVRRFRLDLQRAQNVSEVIKANHRNLAPLDQALRHAARNYLTVGYGVSRRLSTRLPTGAKASEKALMIDPYFLDPEPLLKWLPD